MVNKNRKSNLLRLIVAQIQETVDFADFLNDVVNYQEPERLIILSPSFSPSAFIGHMELCYTGQASVSPSGVVNKRPYESGASFRKRIAG